MKPERAIPLAWVRDAPGNHPGCPNVHDPEKWGPGRLCRRGVIAPAGGSCRGTLNVNLTRCLLSARRITDDEPVSEPDERRDWASSILERFRSRRDDHSRAALPPEPAPPAGQYPPRPSDAAPAVDPEPRSVASSPEPDPSPDPARAPAVLEASPDRSTPDSPGPSTGRPELIIGSRGPTPVSPTILPSTEAGAAAPTANPDPVRPVPPAGRWGRARHPRPARRSKRPRHPRPARRQKSSDRRRAPHRLSPTAPRVEPPARPAPRSPARPQLPLGQPIRQTTPLP